MTDSTNVDEDRTDSFVDEGADPTTPADPPADDTAPDNPSSGADDLADVPEAADDADVPAGPSVGDIEAADVGDGTDGLADATAVDDVDVPAGTSVDDGNPADAADDADGLADAPATEDSADDGVPADAADDGEDELPEGQTEIAVGPEEVVDDETMRRAVEAILMVSDEPLPAMTLARAVGRTTGDVGDALVALAGEYNEQGRGFELREVAGGWRYYTRDDAAKYVERFVLDGQQARLTQAALETLAVVAYKQPVSRARVSAIRGVNVDGVMRTLVTRGLVEEAGTDTESQATLYRTSSYFLERMGMQGLDDLPELAPYLPDMDDVEDELAQQAPAPPAQSASDDPSESAATEAEASDAPGPADEAAQSTGASDVDSGSAADGVSEVDGESEVGEADAAAGWSGDGVEPGDGDEWVGEVSEGAGGGGVRWGDG